MRRHIALFLLVLLFGFFVVAVSGFVILSDNAHTLFEAGLSDEALSCGYLSEVMVFLAGGFLVGVAGVERKYFP
jgi:hypothetical protein